MKAYICDACGKQEKPEGTYDMPPPTWFSIRVGFKGEKHLCSVDCAEAHLEGHRPAVAPPELPEAPAPVDPSLEADLV